MRATVKLETGDMPTRADMDRIRLAGMAAFPHHWHLLFKKTHFTSEGAAKYGYAERFANYTRRKLAIKGHTLPLVFSGVGRAQALAGRNIEVSLRISQAVVAGRVWNIGRPPNSQVDFDRELTAVPGGENAELDRLAQIQVNKVDARI